MDQTQIATAPTTTTTSTQPAAPPTIPYASASLYVGDLSPDVNENVLFDLFNNVGPVASVRVCRDAATRRSLGYAYVNFHRVDDAERALDTLNFSLINGRACRIMWSQRDPTVRKSGQGNIFVKNLAKEIDNKTLFDTFSVFGNILSCKVALNNKGDSVGYGFVHFETDEAARKAIDSVDGKIIADHKVSVAPFKSRQERGVNRNAFTNVFVKNLPLDMNKQQMDDMFTKYGPISSSVIMTDDGKSRGFGFINFMEPEHAQAAIDGLDGHTIGDKKLYVSRAQKRDERRRELQAQFNKMKQEKYAGVNLYIKNLADDVDDNKLREMFSPYGNISSVKVMKHPSTDRSRGFGFVCFHNPEEATKAVTDMNGKIWEGKPLYVALAQTKDSRRAQLEQQWAHRNKMGAVAPGMYPGMYYAAPMPQPRMMYPAQGNRPFANGRGAPPDMSWNYMQPNAPRGRGGRGQHRGRGAYQNPNAGRGRGQQQPYPYQVKGGPALVPVAPVTGAFPVSEIASAPAHQQKQLIGERLFPLVSQYESEKAAKITGMLLEMDNDELMVLIDQPEALREKVDEALGVLQQAQAAQEGEAM